MGFGLCALQNVVILNLILLPPPTHIEFSMNKKKKKKKKMISLKMKMSLRRSLRRRFVFWDSEKLISLFHHKNEKKYIFYFIFLFCAGCRD